VGGQDTAAAVSFLTRQPAIRPGKIAVLGESIGGEQAAAEGATGEQLANRGRRPHDITGILQRGMEWVQYITAGLPSSPAS
jgi:hypothetical protein